MNKQDIFYKMISILLVVLFFGWFWSLNTQLNLELFKNNFSVSLSLYSGIIFLFGFITAVLSSIGSKKSSKIKEMEYEKKLSTTSVDLSKDRAKVEALERKIATLEKALESKIEDNR